MRTPHHLQGHSRHRAAMLEDDGGTTSLPSLSPGHVYFPSNILHLSACNCSTATMAATAAPAVRTGLLLHHRDTTVATSGCGWGYYCSYCHTPGHVYFTNNILHLSACNCSTATMAATTAPAVRTGLLLHHRDTTVATSGCCYYSSYCHIQGHVSLTQISFPVYLYSSV